MTGRYKETPYGALGRTNWEGFTPWRSGDSAHHVAREFAAELV